jgi:hypothetical protein
MVKNLVFTHNSVGITHQESKQLIFGRGECNLGAIDEYFMRILIDFYFANFDDAFFNFLFPGSSKDRIDSSDNFNASNKRGEFW